MLSQFYTERQALNRRCDVKQANKPPRASVAEDAVFDAVWTEHTPVSVHELDNRIETAMATAARLVRSVLLLPRFNALGIGTPNWVLRWLLLVVLQLTCGLSCCCSLCVVLSCLGEACLGTRREPERGCESAAPQARRERARAEASERERHAWERQPGRGSLGDSASWQLQGLQDAAVRPWKVPGTAVVAVVQPPIVKGGCVHALAGSKSLGQQQLVVTLSVALTEAERALPLPVRLRPQECSSRMFRHAAAQRACPWHLCQNILPNRCATSARLLRHSRITTVRAAAAGTCTPPLAGQLPHHHHCAERSTAHN